MKNVAKLTLSILTLTAPLLLISYALAGTWYVRAMLRAGSEPSIYFRLFGLFCLLVWGSLFVFYMIHLRMTPLIPKEKKSLWLGALWGLNVFVMPVYWLRFVYRRHSDGPDTS